MRLRNKRKYIALFMIVVIATLTLYQDNQKQSIVNQSKKVSEPVFETATHTTQAGVKTEKSQDTMEKVTTALEEKDTKVLKTALSDFKKEIKGIKLQLEANSKEVVQKLQDLGIDQGVKRQEEYNSNMAKQFAMLDKKVDDFDKKIERTSSKKEYKALTKEWKEIKDLYQPEEPNQATGSELLNNSIKADARTPIMGKGITPLYQKNLIAGASASKLLPKGEDTELTQETSLSDHIKELAEELKTPVAIYEYVRNQIDFEPYYGSRKGAEGTLCEKAGNDIDQASLMIALLRYQGYPARYIQGTVDIPVEKAMEWTGVSKKETAVKALSKLGIPVTSVTKEGQLYAVRIEHTWVETYVPYEYYRGIEGSEGKSTWVPLDPSFKQYETIEGMDAETLTGITKEEIQAATQNSGEKSADFTTITHVKNEAQQALYEQAKANTEEYIKENGLEHAQMEEIVGGKKIIPEELGVLPNLLPYKVVNVQKEIAQIEDRQREEITFTLASTQVIYYYFEGIEDFSISFPTYELYGKRITLEWKAATAADQQIMDSYGGLENTPSYLVQLRPQIKVDGTVVVKGDDVWAGYYQELTITMKHAGMKTYENANDVIAGGIYSIGLDYGKISLTENEKKQTELQGLEDQITEQNMYSDEVLGVILDGLAKSYFGQLDAYNDILQRATNVQAHRMVSELMTGYRPSVIRSFRIPMEFKGGSFYIDVEHNLAAVLSNQGEKEDEISYTLQSGMMSSSLEHTILEQALGVPSVSTMKILEEANSRGIPIYSLAKENIDRISELKVSDSLKTEIQNVIEAGRTVIIPQEEIQYGEWNGSGYMIYNPETGGASYMLSGGIAGGSICLDLVVSSAGVANFVWAIYDLCVTTGLALAATNSVLMAVYGAIILLTLAVIQDTLHNVMMYLETGNPIYAMNLLLDLIVNLFIFGTVNLLIPNVGVIFRSAISKVKGTKEIMERLGNTITDAVIKHSGHDALKQADIIVQTLRKSEFAEELIEQIAKHDGLKGLEGLDYIIQKGVTKDTVNQLVKEGHNLNITKNLLDFNIHPSQYLDFGIKNASEARWVEYLVDACAYTVDDIKILTKAGFEPSGYVNAGIKTAVDATKISSIITNVKIVGIGDDLISKIAKTQKAEGIENIQKLLSGGASKETVETLIEEGYHLGNSKKLLDEGIHLGNYDVYGIYEAADADIVSKLLQNGYAKEDIAVIKEANLKPKDYENWGMTGPDCAKQVAKTIKEAPELLEAYRVAVNDGTKYGSKFDPAVASIAIDSTQPGKMGFGCNSIYVNNPSIVDISDVDDYVAFYRSTLTDSYIDKMIKEEPSRFKDLSASSIKKEMKKLRDCIERTKDAAREAEMFAEFDKSEPTFQNQWLVENCAEIWAVRDAILNGAQFNKIVLRSVQIRKGSEKSFCLNCRRTFEELLHAMEEKN